MRKILAVVAFTMLFCGVVYAKNENYSLKNFIMKQVKQYIFR